MSKKRPNQKLRQKYAHGAFIRRVQHVCTGIAKMLAEKNKAYGNSYESVPQIMKCLYPGGIRPNQMDNFLLLVRIFDKVKRIVEDNDPYGEDPWLDIAGYSILKLVTREKIFRKKSK